VHVFSSKKDQRQTGRSLSQNPSESRALRFFLTVEPEKACRRDTFSGRELPVDKKHEEGKFPDKGHEETRSNLSSSQLLGQILDRSW